jgi:hypothetical protein
MPNNKQKQKRKAALQSIIDPKILSEVLPTSRGYKETKEKKRVFEHKDPVIVKMISSAGPGPRPSGYHTAQKTIKGVAKGNAVVLAAALPVCCPPVRVPGPYRDSPSATASLYNVSDIDFSTGTNMGDPPLLENGEMTMFVSKDPLHAYGSVVRNPFPLLTESKYQLMRELDVGSIGSLPTSGTAGPNFVYVMPASTLQFDVYSACATPEAASTWSPHGEAYFPFTQCGHNGYYMNASTSNRASFFVVNESSAAIMESETTLTMLSFTGTEWAEVTSAPATGFNAGYVAINVVTVPGTVNGGIYRLRISSNVVGGNAMTFSVFMRTSSDCIGFKPIPGILDHMEHLEAFRVTAASLMYSPTVAKLQEAGTLLGVQLPPNVPLDQFLSYNELSILPGMFQKGLEKGIYGFHKPSTDSELEFKHPFPGLTGDNPRNVGHTVARQSSSSNWYDNGGWLVVNIKVPLGDVGVWPSAKGYMTVNFGCEYMTTSQWPQQLYPAMDWQHYVDLLRDIKSVPQWHENHMHIDDIRQALLGAGRKAIKLAPSLLQILSMYGPPRFRPALGIGKELLEALMAL